MSELIMKYVKFESYVFIKIKKYFMKILNYYGQKAFTFLYKYATLVI